MPGAPLAYYWGDDAYSIEAAATAFALRLGGPDGPPLERWRVSGAETSAGLVGERVATATMFGGGTLAVVSDPAPLLRSRADRDALIAVLGAVAPGNGLAFLETSDGSGRRPAGLEALRDAVAAAGGETREFRAPTREAFAHWIEERARERSVRLGRGAAAALAERVGGFVREGDVDRRRQGQLAVAELEKLAVYRPDGEVSVDDVRSLVADAVPGSMWALLDAVAARRPREAAALLERLFDETPAPVLVAQLHRRLRELLEVADLLDGGASPGSLVRTLKLKPFRAEKLAEQARAWRPAELEDALEGLLELDATIKGADGSGSGAGEAGRRLAVDLWLAERVARARR
ncbi:MAG TPA: DNA polymerase III subunit delta [Candidatus Limnocylindrales bacterium]